MQRITDEEIHQRVSEIVAKSKKPLPMFEILLTLFSYYMAVLLFSFPNLLHDAGGPGFENLLDLMEQRHWGITFFVAGSLKAIGLVLHTTGLRRIGLAISVLIYGTLTVCYAPAFPNFAVGIFSLLALVALVQIFYADYFDFT